MCGWDGGKSGFRCLAAGLEAERPEGLHWLPGDASAVVVPALSTGVADAVACGRFPRSPNGIGCEGEMGLAVCGGFPRMAA